jgi:hypothetical protein
MIYFIKMKVTLCPAYSVKIELEQVDLTGDTAKLTSEISTRFKASYPHMKKMNPAFFDSIAAELRMNRSFEVSVNSMKFWKQIHAYQRKLNIKRRTVQ